LYRAHLYGANGKFIAQLHTDDELVLLHVERALLGAEISAPDDGPSRTVVRISVYDPHGVHVTVLHAPGEPKSPPSATGVEGVDLWDIRSGLRTAVELHDTYGDADDILSISQVETLGRLRPHVFED
jgi:hypothetical protein